MDFLIDNLYDFIKTCFWHYCLVLDLALLWFVVSGGRKNKVLYVFVIGFLCTFAFHVMLHQSTSRYMLTPTLLALAIIAVAAVALWRKLSGKYRRWGVLAFCLLALGFVTLSFLKFNRKGRNRRDAIVLRAASLIRDDFKVHNMREALLIGNSEDSGLIFLYADIPGKFYNYASESGNPQRFDSQVELHYSQYPLVYVLKEQRYNKSQNNKIFERDLHSPHSYKNTRIDRGSIDPKGKYGRVELFRIKSQIGVTTDRALIDGFVGAPPELLKNGNFIRWQESRLSPNAQFGNRFLAEHPKQRLPAEWSVDFNNHRSADFTTWSFAYTPPDAVSASGVWRIHAPRGGFALQSLQNIPADKDCRLKVAAELSSGCKLLAFLYVFRKNHTYLSTQPVGIYHCEKSGDRLLSFPILRNSLPAGGAFFHVGLIGWQGDLSLKKADIVLNERKD